MLVWINGAFGSGKTSLANEVCAGLPEHVLFDPEFVGFLLGDLPARSTGDFQDLPVWRELVVATIGGLRRHYPDPIVVPMTLVVPRYLAEIFDGITALGERLHHFWLDVPREQLRTRIADQVMDPHDKERNDRIARWREKQIDRCLQARDLMPETTVFLPAGRLGPAALADRVLETIGVER